MIREKIPLLHRIISNTYSYSEDSSYDSGRGYCKTVKTSGKMIGPVQYSSSAPVGGSGSMEPALREGRPARPLINAPAFKNRCPAPSINPLALEPRKRCPFINKPAFRRSHPDDPPSDEAAFEVATPPRPTIHKPTFKGSKGAVKYPPVNEPTLDRGKKRPADFPPADEPFYEEDPEANWLTASAQTNFEEGAESRVCYSGMGLVSADVGKDGNSV